jgi:lipopolysaccharide export system protein LptA
MPGVANLSPRYGFTKTMPGKYKIVILGCMLFALVSATFAGNPSKTFSSDKPVNIYARTIEIDEKTGIAWYRGDVSITDGEFFLKADRVQVITRDREIEIFNAFGAPVDVKRRAPDQQIVMTAKALRATYNVKTQKLDMFDHVELHQQGSELRCAEVHYDVQTGRFFGKGDEAEGRCSVLMQPRTNQPKTGTTSGTVKQ